MYVITSNGILLYDGIDKPNLENRSYQAIAKELFQNYELGYDTIDCDTKGRIVFDAFSGDDKHFIKCYNKAN